MATFVGTSGADLFVGGPGDDDIRGEQLTDVPGGADTLSGGGGNDYIEGGPGGDTLHGDAGDDTIYAGDGPSTVGGYLGYTPFGSDQLYGDDGNDLLVGNLTLRLTGIVVFEYGGAGDDHLVAGVDPITYMDGGAGDDRLDGNPATFTTAVYTDATSGVSVDLGLTTAQNTGGAGTDTLTGINGVIGSPFDDVLIGNDQANALTGGLGDDILNGGPGSDTAAYVSAANGVTVDLTIAGPQDTGEGKDTLVSIENVAGSFFNNQLTGDGGDNVLSVFGGDDILRGGGGNDTLADAGGSNILDGGPGDDTASLQFFGVGPFTGYTVDLSISGPQQVRAGEFDTFISVENLIGTSFGDTFTGDGGANMLQGLHGNDTLTGGGGDDTLDGGMDDDTARYSGQRADYLITYDVTGQPFTISDLRPGAPDGVDTLTNVEHFAFADATVDSISFLSTFAIQTLSATNTEGNTGSRPFTFIVSRSGGAAVDSSVAYFVSSSQAGAADFVGGALPSGVVDFAPGETSKTITIQVAGDTAVEQDEAFAVQLSAPVNGTIDPYRGSANGIIVNDDLIPPPDASSIVLKDTADVVNYSGRASGVTVEALGGSDSVIGTRFSDQLNGGDGSDGLNGLGGNDVLRGGGGSDRVSGGSGDDNFVFFAGDLMNARGGADHIIDFHSLAGSGSEHDIISLFGFGPGTTLTFDRYAGGGGSLQYYRVDDPGNPADSGYILVQMANGTAKLTAGDYSFGHKLNVDFEDIAGQNGPLADGYHGFNWRVAADAGGLGSVYTDVQTATGGGSVDATQTASGPFGQFPIDIVRSDGGLFQFDGGDLISSWDSVEVIALSGLRNGVVVRSQLVTLSDTAVSHVDTSAWGAIDELRVDFVSGTPDSAQQGVGFGNNILLDNLSFTTFL